MKQPKRNNQEKLERFKGYVLSNKDSITYKTYVMFNSTCNHLLNEFLTSRDYDLLLDLKEHTMFMGTIYKYIQSNNPNEEFLPQIKDKFQEYKDWIIRESDMNVSN